MLCSLGCEYTHMIHADYNQCPKPHFTCCTGHASLTWPSPARPQGPKQQWSLGRAGRGGMERGAWVGLWVPGDEGAGWELIPGKQDFVGGRTAPKPRLWAPDMGQCPIRLCLRNNKFSYKLMKNFKTAAANINTQTWDPLWNFLPPEGES